MRHFDHEVGAARGEGPNIRQDDLRRQTRQPFGWPAHAQKRSPGHFGKRPGRALLNKGMCVRLRSDRHPLPATLRQANVGLALSLRYVRVGAMAHRPSIMLAATSP